MKNIVKSLLLILFITGNATASEYEMVYTEKGYPYKNLVQRTDIVKIFYTEDKTDVTCRVEVNVNGVNWQSKQRIVNKPHFLATPLASCLSRQRAKEILAATFK